MMAARYRPRLRVGVAAHLVVLAPDALDVLGGGVRGDEQLGRHSRQRHARGVGPQHPQLLAGEFRTVRPPVRQQ